MRKKLKLHILWILIGFCFASPTVAENSLEARILNFHPATAIPGKKMAIEFRGFEGEVTDYSKNKKLNLEVTFDAERAEILELDPGLLTVAVPTTLDRRNSKVTVFLQSQVTGERISAAIEVLFDTGTGLNSESADKPNLEIANISPSKVVPGTEIGVMVTGFSDSLPVTGYVDGLKAPVYRQSQNFFTLVVPDKIHANRNAQLILLQDDKQISGRFEIVGLYSWERLAVAFGFAPDPIIGAGIAAGFLLFFILFIVLTRKKLGVFREEPKYSTAQISLPDAQFDNNEVPDSAPGVEPVIPPPQLPDQLIANLKAGEVALSMGTGLGTYAGLPTWQAMFETLVERLRGSNDITEPEYHAIRSVLLKGQGQHAADALLASGPDSIVTKKAINALFLDSQPNYQPSTAHQILAELPFSVWLNGGFDNLMIRLRSDDPVFSPESSEAAIDSLAQGKPFVYNLFGSLAENDEIILGMQQYLDEVSNNRAYRELLQFVFESHMVLFIGSSLTTIEELMRGVEDISSRKTHFAIAVVDGDDWQLRSSSLKRRYGIEVIPVAFGNHAEVIENLLRELSEASPTIPSFSRNEASEGDTLDSIYLENIGPFKKQTVYFNHRWSLLLGDNGVGKSTILKAIAVALCGEEASDFAERIISRKSDSAEIELRFRRNTYRVLLKRSSRYGVEIRQPSGSSALMGENLLAIGFPALRTITWDRPKVANVVGAGRATVFDVLPVLTDDPDPRLDSLKNQLVALDHARARGDERAATLFDDFFHLFEVLVPGLEITFSEINPQTREVTVTTPDGNVPLESLSQGTISIISWVGVVLQRLHDISPDPRRAEEQHALVLIDEIDAHMHPAWQVQVVKVLASLFPNVQFIATTHSPLVIRGLESSQVLRFKREDGEVLEVDVETEMTMGRADQLLAGSLFDVDADLDLLTQEYVRRYKELLSEDQLNEQSQRELEELEQILEYRIPVPMTSESDRRAYELVEALLNSYGMDAAQEDQLINKVSRLMDSVNREKGEKS